jgi:peptide/nickel transport system substrate-binding protein
VGGARPSFCPHPTLGILDSKLVKQHGATDAANAETGDTAQKWLDQHSAGSGPYMLTGWKPLDQISFAVNTRYWRGEPPFKYLILRHVADSTTALDMLRDGKVDVVENLDSSLVDTAKAEKDLWVATGQSLDMLYLGMTSNARLSKELSDSRVRRAVAAAIDYDAIISGALRGFGVRAPSVIPVGMPGVDAAQTQGRDLQKARTLLKEAGYEGGFTVDLTYGASATREVVATEIKKDLAEVGITVNLLPLEQTEYLSRMRARQLAFALGTWTPDYVDVTAWTHFFSYPDLSMATRMWYDSPAIQAIARGIEAESDPANRVALTAQWQTQMQQDMAFTMIYQRQVATALSNKVAAGFVYHPVYYFSPFDGLK